MRSLKQNQLVSKLSSVNAPDSLKYHDKKYNGKAIKIESLMSKCQMPNATWSKRNHRPRSDQGLR